MGWNSPKHCIIVATALLAIARTALSAIAIQRDYESESSFNEDARVQFTVNREAKTIALALEMRSEALAERSSNTAWVGLGIGEESSGSMLGADIATVEFEAGVMDSCNLTDRHVPFTAYPLIEEPRAFPVADSCQNDGSWTLVQCARDENGTVIFEVERGLDAHDDQDRPVGPGAQSLMYAFGSSFTYHGRSRMTKRVVFYNEDRSPVEVFDGASLLDQLPEDVTYNATVRATEYKVPSQEVTTYSCTSFELDTGPNGVRYLVAGEPVLETTQGRNLAHHFLIYACESIPYFETYKVTNSCLSNGPLGNPDALCTSLVYPWAVGSNPLILPPDVGYKIDNKNKYLVLETHFDNPELLDDVVDISGARLYFTDKPRKFEAGTLGFGDNFVSLAPRTVIPEFEYQSTCPSSCSSKWKEPLNVFATLPHMHTTGRSMFLNRFSKGGEFIENVNKVEYWSNDHQIAQYYDPPKQILPGEVLSNTCIYDTSKRPETIFGLETKNEMCINFILYWPAQRLQESDGALFSCGMLDTKKGNVTMCGDTTNLNEELLQEPNPSFNDTIDTPAVFGRTPETCDAPQISDGANNESATPDEASGSNGGEGGDDDGVCFPGMAAVELCDGSQKHMNDLEVGDRVAVGTGKCSEVFMFTHRMPSERHRFTVLHMDDNKQVTLTKSHFLYVNGERVPASEVRVGDTVENSDGGQARVAKITSAFAQGLFNPQTLHGDIIVNGIRVSTYTKHVMPSAAHALLAPFRCMREQTGWYTSVFHYGARTLVRLTQNLQSVI